jgi:Holliday junction resolvase RusA-like endonuclease
VVIALEVLGTPAPKGSSRPMLNRKTGKPFSFAGGSKSTELKLGAWDSAVRTAAIGANVSATGPLFVERLLAVKIEFRIARPSGHWAKRGGLKPTAAIAPGVKPDIDKLARSTLDSLTGIVFDDDSRIVRLNLAKVYATPGKEGAQITVEEWRPA